MRQEGREARIGNGLFETFDPPTLALVEQGAGDIGPQLRLCTYH
jgi:hypothetical protein